MTIQRRKYAIKHLLGDHFQWSCVFALPNGRRREYVNTYDSFKSQQYDTHLRPIKPFELEHSTGAAGVVSGTFAGTRTRTRTHFGGSERERILLSVCRLSVHTIDPKRLLARFA